ncbi:retinol dehydrogenase 14-like [Oppia nitens]|uniref:retinol dehydrogenase 14-like n=1 Tax=Oppia nitens TaxID=1686743 RepID=UPI0023DCDB3C|nr:retinol dehydrogenase 14-like [Oppia nitens]
MSYIECIQYTSVSLLTAIITYRLICQHFVWKSKKDINTSLNGKTVVITGATAGIGKETAKELAKRGARVVMGCRDKRTALEVIQEITANNDHKTVPNVIYKNIDLCSFSSVKDFAEDIIKSERSVDILINNAAVLGPPFALTTDGFETQMQTNHLSSALLTLLLLPKMQSSTQTSLRSRILMITSTLYRKGVINDNDFIKENVSNDTYNRRQAYNNSKLANILFARHLHRDIVRHNLPIDVVCVSPGIVWTKLGRHLPLKWWQYFLLLPFAALFVRTPRQGSQTPIHCATSRTLISDSLYRNCIPKVWEGNVCDRQLSDKVYELTMKIIDRYLP